jgi:hypothetical protein
MSDALAVVRRHRRIPVRGGDFIERDGWRYAVLFDVDRKMVVAYAIVGDRLRAAKAGELFRAASSSKQSGIRLPANCRDVSRFLAKSFARCSPLSNKIGMNPSDPRVAVWRQFAILSFIVG